MAESRGQRAAAALKPGRARAAALVLAPVVLLFAGGCDLVAGAHLAGRAADDWVKTYQLAPGGEVRVTNTNGRIEVEGVDGSTVEIRAEKIARAASDTGARELLPRITIKEDVSSTRIAIETEKLSGILLGAAFEVRYHVKAPRGASVNVVTTNGGVGVTGLNGKVVAQTTNGGVTAKEINGELDARTTNGGVTVDLASLGAQPVSARTVNGGVTLTLPESAKADVSASCVNGGITIAPEFKMDVSEQSRRRFEGRLNGGGIPIELHTVNGGVRIRTRA